jgi:phage-related baseplate assembly protein
MNEDTKTLIQRPYAEIVGDLLTAIVGGVVNEPHFFDVKEDLYRLEATAVGVREITGTRVEEVDGQLEPVHYVFQQEVDYMFDPNPSRNAVIWVDGGKRPEDETVFYVDYYRPDDGRHPLTDVNVGSVTRTLSEAIAREIATVYEQVNQAYRSGFVDTATGEALDLVVSILDVHRLGKEYARGDVTFFRDLAVPDGSVTIPPGTLVTTTKGEASFVTTELRTLQRGQVQISVPIQASTSSPGEAGIVKAGAITTLVQPIIGIARVTNQDDTVLAADQEDDEALRARAKMALRASSKATILALIRAIVEARGKVLEVWDPNGPPAKQSKPGTVTLLIDAEPKRLPALRTAAEEVRAAGVQVTLVGRYVFMKPGLRITLQSDLTGPGQEKVLRQIIEAMQGYVDKLEASQPAKGEELLKAVKEVKEVKDPVFVDVMTWKSDLGQPGPETLVSALLDAIAASPPGDRAALELALTAVVEETASPIPTGERIPDRSLVQGEIATGKFEVTPEEGWSIVLDVEPADIQVE